MKIATITCHDVYNYGASLQAYALQEYCTTLGHDYEIINYKPPYLSNHYKLGLVANPKYNKLILRELYLVTKLPSRLVALKKKREFDSFTSKYLRLSCKRYASCNDIANDCPDADIYIAGSDQIWNTLFRNGRDSAFYLDFVRSGARRISYAASFATDSIHDGYDQFVGTMLRNFDAISVRESSALQLLVELGRNDGHLVCDPVFLLTSDDWGRLINKEDKDVEDYIFVYDCERSPAVRSVAEKLKRYTGMKIYAVSSTYGKYADKDLSMSGPLEFLQLLANARYVVANSFHALAFSVIFEKDFFIINRSEGINTRMRDFLSYLNLPERLISESSEIVLDNIDYSKVRHFKERLINDSKKFLSEQFEKVM